MRKLVGGLVAAGIAAGLAAGTTAVLAANTPKPTAAKPHHGILAHLQFGEVDSVTTSGGSLGAGQVVISEPDGTQITLNLSSKTRVLLFHGKGVKPTPEAVTALSQGELVAARGPSVDGTHFVRRILDLGFKAQS